MLQSLEPKVLEIITDETKSVDTRLGDICELLRNSVDHYDWVGFYFRNGDKEELKLGPYAGTPTDHTIIPFGKGICGQVAVSNQNFVVPDVAAQAKSISIPIPLTHLRRRMNAFWNSSTDTWRRSCKTSPNLLITRTAF